MLLLLPLPSSAQPTAQIDMQTQKRHANKSVEVGAVKGIETKHVVVLLWRRRLRAMRLRPRWGCSARIGGIALDVNWNDRVLGRSSFTHGACLVWRSLLPTMTEILRKI
eukprot:TRINITY_DN10628_c0_g3_i1.p2 TRINITY_DN10628_c0_g3~~TRINITY_DN10628_c0_g3_i1.p2  ORF type:complete len:109 (-),score=3.58 TRINITY_DN10628_c0_g3_i1:69-395(-)